MPPTSDPVAGIVTYFGLSNGTAPEVVDVSTYLDSVELSSDTDELDGTNFQAPAKKILPGFTQRSGSLGGKWSTAAHAFWRSVEGKSGLNYEYGPEGGATGAVLLTGECSCFSYSGPIASVDDVTTYTVELRIDTMLDSTVPVALRGGDERSAEERSAAERTRGRAA